MAPMNNNDSSVHMSLNLVANLKLFVNLLQKIAELTEILQARESKLVQMSKDNNDLMETTNILRK